MSAGNNERAVCLLSAILIAMVILATGATGATALAIPGTSEYEPRDSIRRPHSEKREVRVYYRSAPETANNGREIRMSYRNTGRHARNARSSSGRLKPARWPERSLSSSSASQSSSTRMMYKNSPNSYRNRRGAGLLIRIPGRADHQKSQGKSTRTVASWYGWDFHGRKTANGEVYNMYDHTAAHKTLPFGTIVRVTNLSNGRQATVRINDRGPFIHGRGIDLSYATARDLGMLESGIEKVRLEIISG